MIIISQWVTGYTISTDRMHNIAVYNTNYIMSKCKYPIIICIIYFQNNTFYKYYKT